MDEFKKYIQSQRELVEKEIPNPSVWEAVRASIEVPVKPIRFRNWAIAASLILVTGTSILFWNQSKETKTSIVKTQQKINGTHSTIDSFEIVEKTIPIAGKNQKNKPNPIPAASIITTIHTVHELSEVDQTKLSSLEASFKQVINMQKARISTTPLYAESPNYFSAFYLQLHQIEKDEKQIAVYIKNNGMSDELLEQLINVYQHKLNLLKQLQIEIQKLNSRYKQNRPAIDTLKTYFLNL